MKKLFVLMFSTLLIFSACSKKNETAEKNDSSVKIAASTSWTAAFADIAGADQVITIAPASLRHPPEYEITVSDIQNISSCDYFIYAGFERMMKTIGDTAGNAQMVQIQCNNSIATVTDMTQKIAALLGTEEECQKRLKEYVDEIKKGAKKVEEAGLKDTVILCNKNQIYLAEDLGFKVDTFGPGEVTSEQLVKAKNGNYAYIIDNVHNPVGAGLAEAAPQSKYIIWRNFPAETGRNALKNVIQSNIETLGL